MKRLIIILAVLSAFLQVYSQDRLEITHGPYLQHLSENEVTVVWTTSKDAVSWVELAPDDTTHFYLMERPKYFSAEFGFKDVGRLHAVRLTNLSPATTYRYRIYSKEVLKHEGTRVQYGTTVASDVYRREPLRFTTTDPEKKDISFLVINDIHGKNDLLENLLKKGDFENSDLVFFNGDMTNDIRSEDQLFSDFMDTAIRLFAKEKPMYYARGNHETRGNFANSFPLYFPSPSGKLYYLLRQGPVCFIVLDCGEDKPDSDIEYSEIVAFDQYREAEERWLRSAVKESEFTDAPFKVAIIHMPPFGGWYGEEEIARRFVPILNDAGIDIMFCGHLHRYIKQSPDSVTNFPVIVNSNTTVLKAITEGNFMNIKIINEKGEIVDSLTVR